MKSIVLLALLLTTLLSSTEVKNKKMIVTKDCTGSYLSYNKKHYKICNERVVEYFNSGAIVIASFEIIDKCKNDNKKKSVCRMYHPNDGLINVTRIRQSLPLLTKENPIEYNYPNK